MESGALGKLIVAHLMFGVMLFNDFVRGYVSDMSERADDLIKSSVDGKKKYDYFVATIATALFAYIGKDFTPEEFGLNQSSFVLLSLMAFVVSIVATLKKIELKNNCLERNGKLIDLQVKKEQYLKCLAEREQIIHEGKVNTFEDMQLEILAIDEVLPNHTNTLNSMYKKTDIYTSIRDWTLFIGFTLMAFSKLLPVFI